MAGEAAGHRAFLTGGVGRSRLITSAASAGEQRALRCASWPDSPLQSGTHHLLSSTRNYYDSDLDLRGSVVGFRCVFIEGFDGRCASPFLLLPRRPSCFHLRSRCAAGILPAD
jgi:hypothetical protein